MIGIITFCTLIGDLILIRFSLMNALYIMLGWTIAIFMWIQCFSSLIHQIPFSVSTLQFIRINVSCEKKCNQMGVCVYILYCDLKHLIMASSDMTTFPYSTMACKKKEPINMRFVKINRNLKT